MDIMIWGNHVTCKWLELTANPEGLVHASVVEKFIQIIFGYTYLQKSKYTGILNSFKLKAF
jgi:hypothetical protein